MGLASAALILVLCQAGKDVMPDSAEDTLEHIAKVQACISEVVGALRLRES